MAEGYSNIYQNWRKFCLQETALASALIH